MKLTSFNKNIDSLFKKVGITGNIIDKEYDERLKKIKELTEGRSEKKEDTYTYTINTDKSSCVQYRPVTISYLDAPNIYSKSDIDDKLEIQRKTLEKYIRISKRKRWVTASKCRRRYH